MTGSTKTQKRWSKSRMKRQNANTVRIENLVQKKLSYKSLSSSVPKNKCQKFCQQAGQNVLINDGRRRRGA